jgi:RNA polymerase sigma factor (sigma-70 family)
VVGEVLLQVVRDLGTFAGDEAGFRAWVFTIAHRRLLDARRREARRPVEPTTVEDLEPALPVAEAEPEALAALTTQEVLALLDRLTEDQREVLVLRLVGGLRGREIAEVTGRDVEAVKGLARRGLDRLRELLTHGSQDAQPKDRPPPDAARER